MLYERLGVSDFFERVRTEDDARALLWRARCDGKEFVCPRCSHEGFYQYECRPEIRKCRLCDLQVRLRSGTMLQNSKLPILTWVRAVFLAMQDKRGVSALQLQRELACKTYRSVWRLLHKVREALRQRDAIYKLQDVIELDGAHFGSQACKGEAEVLVAVETKDWVDDKGRTKTKAGFAKIKVAHETKINAQEFANQAFVPGSMVNTDGDPALINLKGVEVDYQVVEGIPEILDRWLPWVHHFIGNAKSWLIGTHHGIHSKYLGQYLAEYTYRFNRRHDPNSLFHRALTACAIASPVTVGALCA